MKLMISIHTFLVVSLGLSTITLCSAKNADTPKQEEEEGESITRYIIKFKDHTRFQSSQTKLQNDPSLIMSLPGNNIHVVSIDSSDSSETENGIKYWEDHEDVEFVEQDSKIYQYPTTTDQTNNQLNVQTNNVGEVIPWGINDVKALAVDDSTDSNQKVCIIDSGYDLGHPDLPDGAVTGYSQIPFEPWSEDGNGHGTHVAGIIAGIGNNDQGIVGVTRNGKLQIHVVKIFNNNGDWTYNSDLIQAIEECASANSTVVNMSLGGPIFNEASNQAMTKAFVEDNMLLVAAAGNDGTPEKNYPASYSVVMSVAAVDEENVFAPFSQHNYAVDISAPGVNILSTETGGGYVAFNGTSMATPHVTGVAALVWSHYPSKTAVEIRSVLEYTAQDLGTSGRDDDYGHGLVRADLAYDFLQNGNKTLCVDSPIGWYDNDGPIYNCEWYAEGSKCADEGDFYSNHGKTANQACCACNGGSQKFAITKTYVASE
jgi:subtilisin family serine protease